MINAPFADCKSAELHHADSVQSYGALLVLDAGGLIVAASANCSDWLGVAPAKLLGRCADEFLPPNVVARPRDVELHLQELQLCGRACVAATHASDVHTLIELEDAVTPLPGRAFDPARALHGMRAIGAGTSVEDVAAALMREIAAISGFDRVMLYRFLPDWHGKVIAEVCKEGVEGFLGLQFPASDIPENARRLYLLKRQRIIADAAAGTVAVLAARPGLRVNMTRSELRAVHPTHLEYLANLGVRASFSVSVLVNGALWGLIACHKLRPARLSFAQRQLCEQLAEVAAIHMSDLQRLQREQQRHAHHLARAHVAAELRLGTAGVAAQLGSIRRAFGASGAWARLDGAYHVDGVVPPPEDLDALRGWVDAQAADDIVARERIDAGLQGRAALRRCASGLLLLPLRDGDFLMLLRPEQVEAVSWAGKPEAPGTALGPRQSFAIWREQTSGSAQPWGAADREAAAELRDMLFTHFEWLRLRRLALSDPLTGLANRAEFERGLREAMDVARRDDSGAALLLLDLDRFKPVNDAFGHGVGDAVLREVAARMRQHARSRDLLARLGGDEFAIVQFHGARQADVAGLAQRLVEALRQPYAIDGRRIEISASIGIALYPQHGGEMRDLIEHADQALYAVKRGSRDGFSFYGGSAASTRFEPQ